MYSQRLLMALFGMLTLISPFFGWTKIAGVENHPSLIAMMGIGNNSVSLYIPLLIIIVGLYNFIIPFIGDKTNAVNKFKVIIVIPCILSIIATILILTIFGDTGAIGLYLNLIGNGLFILFTLIDFEKLNNNSKINNQTNQ